MRQRKRIPRKRERPRQKRPWLFFKPKDTGDSWPAISMRMRLKWWNSDQDLICGICVLPILRWGDLVPDHIEPGKMGGCKDNSPENLQPAHWLCNLEKGSKRGEAA